MNTLDVLKNILSGNATGSKRLEEIKNRHGKSDAQGGRGLEDVLGSILGGGNKAARAEESRVSHQKSRPRSSEPTSPSDVGSMLEDLLGVGDSDNAKPPSRQIPEQRELPKRKLEPAPVSRPRSSSDTGRRPHRKSKSESDHATLLIRAMCNAAKVDGQIDRSEQDAILTRLGNVGRDELDFVRRELSTPLDIDDYCRSVPSQLAEDAYTFSVMAIKLDTLNEAAYLGRLGAGLGLDPRTCNRLHEKVGVPSLYPGP